MFIHPTTVYISVWLKPWLCIRLRIARCSQWPLMDRPHNGPVILWYLLCWIHQRRGMKYVSKAMHFLFHNPWHLPFGNISASYENTPISASELQRTMQWTDALYNIIVCEWFLHRIFLNMNLNSYNHIHQMCCYMEYRSFNVLQSIVMAESRLAKWPMPWMA